MSTGITPKFLIGARKAKQFPRDAGAEVAFAGRSNSGKSSAINAICGRRGLARTSKQPGRTREINFFSLSAGERLVDLPGYGYAKVAESVRLEWASLLEAYFLDRRCLRGLFITMDLRRDLGELDEVMLGWSREAGVPVAVLLTKADKLSRSAAVTRQRRIAAAVGPDLPLIMFSATKRLGVDEAGDVLLGWLGLDAPGSAKK
ncbi:MAG TPA: ribosome biogenesis GTP-binding protein YihA/YsxC [Gammaproteobacteria bacterium]|jgi:GTP-binding protein